MGASSEGEGQAGSEECSQQGVRLERPRRGQGRSCMCVCMCAHVYVGVEGGLNDFCYELHLMVQIQRELLVGVSVPDMTAKPWISVDATTDAGVQTRGRGRQPGGRREVPLPPWEVPGHHGSAVGLQAWMG